MLWQAEQHIDALRARVSDLNERLAVVEEQCIHTSVDDTDLYADHSTADVHNDLNSQVITVKEANDAETPIIETPINVTMRSCMSPINVTMTSCLLLCQLS